MILKLVPLDTETTGTLHKEHGIIQLAGEIGFYNTETGTYEKKESFNYNVNVFPNDKIEQGALDVNKRTIEEIKTFEAPQSVHRKFVQLLGKYCNKFDRTDKYFFVAYNAPFDYDFMREWFVKCDDPFFGSWFWTPPVCVMQKAGDFLLEERHLMPNFKLETVAKRLDIHAEGDYHDAMTDIVVTRLMWLKLKQPSMMMMDTIKNEIRIVAENEMDKAADKIPA